MKPSTDVTAVADTSIPSMTSSTAIRSIASANSVEVLHSNSNTITASSSTFSEKSMDTLIEMLAKQAAELKTLKNDVGNILTSKNQLDVQSTVNTAVKCASSKFADGQTD